MIETPTLNTELEYIPAPARPADFDRRLKQICGLCPTGEPYLRFSWAMDVTEVLNGKEIRRYPDWKNKYVGADRWVLEGWQSPDVYNKRQWEENADIMGPWPANGVWDFIAFVETSDKQYKALGEGALQMAREWRHWRSKDRPRLLEDLLENRCRLQVAQEKQLLEKRQEIFDELLAGVEREERGDVKDTRKKTLLGKITGGEYQQTATGLLIPKLA